MILKLGGKLTLLVLYLVSFGFLFSTPYLVEYPVDDEASYVEQTKLLLSGKTQPNWLLSTSYLTMLAGMPIIQHAFSFFNLRLLMMIIAATTTPLMYLLLREFDVKKSIAILGAFVLITSPFVAVHLRQFITEPISLPLYLASTLLIVKGIKVGSNRYLLLGALVGVLGFLNRQIDIIPAMAAFLFFVLHGNVLSRLKLNVLADVARKIENLSYGFLSIDKKSAIKQPFKKLLSISPALIFLIVFLLYMVLTAGNVTNPITVPTSKHHVLQDPQFGISLQSPYRLLQDVIYLGFMFLPFAPFIWKHIRPKFSILGKHIDSKKFLLAGSLFIGFLAALSGKAFIVHSDALIIMIVTAAFSYGGLSLLLLIMHNRARSKIINYCFIVLIVCIVFTFFKISIFIIKYYIIFLPFILVFLATRIKEKTPYILTVLLLGGFGILLTINSIQFYNIVWSNISELISQGVEPTNIQGQYTVVNWLVHRVDNPSAEYTIVWENDRLFNEFVNLSSIKIVS